MHGISANARFNDLTLMQSHSGLAKAKIQCWIISTTKQATSIKLATTVVHFLRDLDFENVYMAWQLVTCAVFFLHTSILNAVRKGTSSSASLWSSRTHARRQARTRAHISAQTKQKNFSICIASRNIRFLLIQLVILSGVNNSTFGEKISERQPENEFCRKKLTRTSYRHAIYLTCNFTEKRLRRGFSAWHSK